MNRRKKIALSCAALLVAIIVGIGMVLGSLSLTGVGGAFSRELLQYAGDNVYLLLGQSITFFKGASEGYQLPLISASHTHLYAMKTF